MHTKLSCCCLCVMECCQLYDEVHLLTGCDQRINSVSRREQQRAMQEVARQKELDMLEKISDAESVRRLREEERKKREEAEWELQQKLEVRRATITLPVC